MDKELAGFYETTMSFQLADASAARIQARKRGLATRKEQRKRKLYAFRLQRLDVFIPAEVDGLFLPRAALCECPHTALHCGQRAWRQQATLASHASPQCEHHRDGDVCWRPARRRSAAAARPPNKP